MRLRVFLLFIILSFDLMAKGITIGVATNLSYAMEALKEAFYKEYQDIPIEIVVASSGKLTAQIRNGAPYDIFMSANMLYPSTLYKDGLAISKPIVYAKGSIALFSKSRRDFSQGLSILKSKNIKKIALANPKIAPYGMAGLEAIKSAKLLSSIQNRLIFAQNASQTLMYAMRVVDVAIIPKSALFTPKMSHYKKGQNWIDIDPKLYKPIEQGVVVLKNAKDKKEAQEFYQFLQSKRAKEILKSYGYIVQ